MQRGIFPVGAYLARHTMPNSRTARRFAIHHISVDIRQRWADYAYSADVHESVCSRRSLVTSSMLESTRRVNKSADKTASSVCVSMRRSRKLLAGSLSAETAVRATQARSMTRLTTHSVGNCGEDAQTWKLGKHSAQGAEWDGSKQIVKSASECCRMIGCGKGHFSC
jgi:hypothetical protein